MTDILWIIIVNVSILIVITFFVIRYIKKIRHFDVEITSGPTLGYLSSVYENRNKKYHPGYDRVPFLDCPEARLSVKVKNFFENENFEHSYYEVINLEEVLLGKAEIAKIKLSKELSHNVYSRSGNGVIFLNTYFKYNLEYNLKTKKGIGIRYFEKKYHHISCGFPG
ncbi:MAG: hypothetical protein AAB334_02835 [Patescibacteria group bacterium]